ncbi:CorA family divalent cation transporter [Sphingobium sp.]|uniref:CorA family divalent cation transporter n=1 Tax=Sphingobium sp. TaxID=1912891 RepID=UPI002C00C2CB|nr:CorA family divalent cation transporter [Sphingobium sp.]HUD95168.1 CorA family divalent cation transporter [Sphingobium sp.]
MPFSGLGPGLVWGLDFGGGEVSPVDRCDISGEASFRWLHLNLADHGTQRWIREQEILPVAVRDLLLAPETHQRALVEGDTIGCVFHDFERDFDVADTARVGALRLALMPRLMLTCRLHPLRSADIAKSRLTRAAIAIGPPQALELLVNAIGDNIADISRTLSADVQQTEDAFLDGHHPPTARDLIGIRRRLAQIHRLLSGMRGVFQRLEQDDELPDILRPSVEKLAQSLQSLDADILGAQSQLRLLREELDIQESQRTNQNLYILSIVTALMLPATLVTGIFGMNTGGLPLADGPYGTLHAALLATGAAAATYFLLRWMGFMRR